MFDLLPLDREHYGEEDDQDILEYFRWLEADNSETDPALGAVDFSTKQHYDQQHQRDNHQRPGKRDEFLIVEARREDSRRQR